MKGFFKVLFIAMVIPCHLIIAQVQNNGWDNGICLKQVKKALALQALKNFINPHQSIEAQILDSIDRSPRETANFVDKLVLEGPCGCNDCSAIEGCEPAGPTGATGATGPAGADGSTGATGATGTLASAFGYVFNYTTQTLNPGDDITFDNNGPLSGVIHTASTAPVTVTSAGTYAVFYSVSCTSPNGFSIAVNGSIPGVSPSAYGTNVSATLNTGLCILTLNASDVLTLRNYLPNPVTLGSVPLVILASMLIIRIA